MATVKTTELFAAPAYGLIGNPTTAAGAGLAELGLLPNVTITAEWYRQATTNEILQELADGNWGALRAIVVAITMQKASADILTAIFQEVTEDGDFMGFETELARLVLPTLIIVPELAYGAALADITTKYVPAARPDDLGAFVHRQQQGNDGNPYTITMRGTRRAVDHSDQALKSNAQMYFQGNPAKALADGATAWSLPAGY